MSRIPTSEKMHNLRGKWKPSTCIIILQLITFDDVVVGCVTLSSNFNTRLSMPINLKIPKISQFGFRSEVYDGILYKFMAFTIVFFVPKVYNPWLSGYYCIHDYTENIECKKVDYICVKPWIISDSRLFWASAVATMTIILGIQVYSLIVAYYSYPIQTTTNTQVVSNLSFPAVTICNLSPFSKQYYTPDMWTSNLYLHSTPLSFFENQTLLNCSIPENEEFCNKSSPDAYNIIGQKLTTTVPYCRWQKHHNCVPDFIERVTDLGMCFTFNHNGTFRSGTTGSQKGLWLTLSLNTDYNVISEALSSGMKVGIEE